MSLSWEKGTDGLAIAITSSKSKLWNNKILFLNDDNKGIKTKKLLSKDEVSKYVGSKVKDRNKVITKLFNALEKNEAFNDTNEELNIIYETLKRKSGEQDAVILPPDSKFELLPLRPQDIKDGNQRTTLFVSGMAGSGKTYLCKQFIMLYSEMYPTNKIYFISQQDKDNDPSLKEVRGMMEQISIEDIMNEEQPITWESFISKPCLTFFDDYDGFPTEKVKRGGTSQFKKVQSLIDDLLRNGRKFGISVLISSHDLNKTNKNETILKECEYFCIYPNGIMLYHLNYFGQKYLGLSKQQIKDIKADKSRWIILRRKFPILMLTEYECKIIK